MIFNHKHNASTLSISALVVLALILLSACVRHDKKQVTAAVEDRASMAVLDATDVTTLISDSGVTRYRIKAQSWLVYDKADPPHWEFPEGIYLENFNQDLSVGAYLEADYAYYDQSAQIWRLDGNVRSLNQLGEKFETPQLFWSQKDERVYSDSAITITRETSIIEGIGFESNQEMTKYTIRKPTGIFPIKDE
ncbi:MAG: LPS export ABC transporter periplasmic protein LptC [Paludibacteraceae bacterium]|nr:LPS export ABC transporter periplasmic protein LptC [Paludibacteraceae bacterium]